MLLIVRLLRGSPTGVRWVILAAALALGVALLVYGLAAHSSVVAVRGGIELVLVVVIAVQMAVVARRRRRGA